VDSDSFACVRRVTRDSSEQIHGRDCVACGRGFIRSYTCNLLASDPDLLAASLAALEAECTKVLPLQSSDESGRNREIYRLMDATQPDFVALVWETHENGKIRHTAIASNGMMAVRFDWPGYGHANDQDISPHECETSPWTF